MSGAIAAPGPVAFIGLGNIGGPMAACVARAGWTVRAFDLNPAALDRFVAEHPTAVKCASAAEAASGMAVVITMVPDGRAVRQAMLGPNGAAPAMAPGGLLVDMSSANPADSRTLGADLAMRGINLIDAPVSGGVRSAVVGKLTLMVGGDAALLDQVRPLLGAMATKIFHVGPLGSGHAMKALNNYVSAAALVSTCEALVIGRELGLNPGAMVDVMNVSTGRNSATADKARQYILSGTFGSGGALAMLAKDVRFAAELGQGAGAKAELARGIADLLTRAEAALGPAADHTEVYRYVDKTGAD